jgi:hypothetical protein
MGRKHVPLIAAAAVLMTFGSGCLTTDATKASASKKPDVTQPGVLPPPQAMVRPASATGPGGGVVPAGGVQPAAPAAVAPVASAPAPGASALAKLARGIDRRVVATEMAVAWRNRIAYLPDPSKNGAMGAGLAGQLFLYGGEKLQFALADGTLTVDLIDETPRPAGQPAATPERWQFDKNTLRSLQTRDETWGKSYVLFLPWPAYKPDVTKVRISARYDPDNGHTLYAKASTVTLDTTPFGTPVWSEKPNAESRPSSLGAGSMTGMGNFPPGGLQPGGVLNQPGAPIPVGGGMGMTPGPLPGSMMPPPNAMMMPPNGAAPLMPAPPVGAPMPGMAPGGAMMPPAPPVSAMPGAEPGAAPKSNLVLPEGFPPLTITLPGARQQ